MIYANICKLAKERGISINSLEQQAEVSRGGICKWNNVSPTVRNLKKVANVLGCTLEELVKNSEEEENEYAETDSTDN